MNLTHLASLIQQPEVHQRILGNYSGAYSLGVTLNPENGKEAVISLRVQGNSAPEIARHILLEGQLVSIVVHAHFAAPRPLAS